MSHEIFRNYVALFFTSLAAFLGALFIGNFIFNLPEKPVIVAFGPFEVCKDSKIVKPGGIVCYKIHYYKRLDIPGDLTKTLIVHPFNGDELWIPLDNVAGHLPTGEIKKKACVKLPDWIPDGIGKIKLSSSYYLTNKQIEPNVVYTTEFEVRR